MTHTPSRQLSILLAIMLLSTTTSAFGQSGSLFGQGSDRAPMTQPDASWIYQTPPEVPVIQVHDLITVIVDEKTLVALEGTLDQKKKIDGKMTLTDWSLLKNWKLFPDPQTLGNPAAGYKADSKYKAEGELETRDAIETKITCQVVEIMPDTGQLRLEGTRSIRVNSEQLDFMFSGRIDPEDILPNKTVMSEKVFSPQIIKLDAGSVRDGYRRGIVQKLLNKYQLF